jgi:hypothetical protein
MARNVGYNIHLKCIICFKAPKKMFPGCINSFEFFPILYKGTFLIRFFKYHAKSYDICTEFPGVWVLSPCSGRKPNPSYKTVIHWYISGNPILKDTTYTFGYN